MGVWKIVFIVLLSISAGFSFFADSNALSIAASLKNPYLDYAMGWLTHFGSVFVVLILLTSLFLWEEKKREWIPALWASFLASIGISLLLKLIVARPRPVEEAFFLFNVFNYSFPSMHAAAAFAALPILDKEFPGFKWFWLLFALLVSFSRIYVMAHYLSDVVFGALIGYVVGCLIVYIEDKYRVFRKMRLG